MNLINYVVAVFGTAQKKEPVTPINIPDIQKLIVRLAAGTLNAVSDPNSGFEKLSDVRELYANIKDLSHMLLFVNDEISKQNHVDLWHQLQTILKENLCKAIEKSEGPVAARKKALLQITVIFSRSIMLKEEIPQMKQDAAFYVTKTMPRMEAILKELAQVMRDLEPSAPCKKSLKPEIMELLSL